MVKKLDNDELQLKGNTTKRTGETATDTEAATAETKTATKATTKAKTTARKTTRKSTTAKTVESKTAAAKKKSTTTKTTRVKRADVDVNEPSIELSSDGATTEVPARFVSSGSNAAELDAVQNQSELQGAQNQNTQDSNALVDHDIQQQHASNAQESSGRKPSTRRKSVVIADASLSDEFSEQKRAQKQEKQEKPEKQEKQEQKQNNNQGHKQNNNQIQGKNNKGSYDRNGRRTRRHLGNREVLPSISRDELSDMKVGDLREKAAEYSIDASGYRKAELVDVVFEALCKAEGIIEVAGILDIMNDGYGFLRTKGYLPSEADAYVSLSIIRRNGLRKGDYMVGLTRPAQGNEKYAAIQKVISVNDIPADELGGRPRFSDLTPVYPDERLIMEHGKNTTTARVIDLVSPIGKGQRGLIVSPPKAGKTTILKDVAAAISANNPEVHLMCLLVDERPEEVTDMERSINGEVISSTFDKPCENHIAVAELVIERAKRLVEQGRDVVILLDSITRLARAYNMGTPASGRILSGGVDSSALYPPKRFLGAARNIENGGSLTILGTALVDTGSKMDEVIFEEFKGTGNMELKLDRALADRRIFPAIDPITSGTRKEELLLDTQEAPLIWAVRRVLANLNNTERAMDTLVKSIKQTETNQEFLIRFARKAQTSQNQNSLDL